MYIHIHLYIFPHKIAFVYLLDFFFCIIITVLQRLNLPQISDPAFCRFLELLQVYMVVHWNGARIFPQLHQIVNSVNRNIGAIKIRKNNSYIDAIKIDQEISIIFYNNISWCIQANAVLVLNCTYILETNAWYEFCKTFHKLALQKMYHTLKAKRDKSSIALVLVSINGHAAYVY